jgi:hypothetical protein
VLALIGEQIDPDNFINGVYLQVRRGNPRRVGDDVLLRREGGCDVLGIYAGREVGRVPVLHPAHCTRLVFTSPPPVPPRASQDKHARNVTALRLDVWFATDDDAIMDYICEELRLLLKKECADLPFRFSRIMRKK